MFTFNQRLILIKFAASEMVRFFFGHNAQVLFLRTFSFFAFCEMQLFPFWKVLFPFMETFVILLVNFENIFKNSCRNIC